MSQSRNAFRLAAAFALLAFAAAPSHAGLVMKQTLKSDGENGMNQTSRVSLDTGGAKIEMLDSSNPIMPAGSYILIRPDDDAMVLVNPEKRTYSTLDLAAISQSMNAMTQMNPGGGEGLKREASKPVVEKLLDESGGAILGRPTRHYRYHLQWSMTMEMAPGMALIMENDSVEDTWVSDLAIDARTMRAFEGMGAGMSLPKDIQAVVDAQKEMVKGLPLKRITVAKTKMTGTGMMAAMAGKMSKHSDKPTTTTIDVVELSEEKVPASTFAIPAGYTETEMVSPGMQMPDMNQRH